MSDRVKYLLCRPRGGLSDSLSAIERCRQYCLSTGRTLVVDGVRSNFVRNFARVLDSDAAILQPSTALLDRLDSVSCRPVEVEGRLRRYRATVFTAPGENFLEWRVMLDARSGVALHSTLDDDWPEEVIVHEAHGDGLGGEEFLAHCRLAPAVSRRVRERLQRVTDASTEDGYVGIHVRNSDLQTHWRTFFAEHADRLAGSVVVVCSDDRHVVREAPSLLGRSRVITPTRVPVSNGVPYQGRFVPRWRHARLAVDAFVDLLALAGADDILAPTVINRTDPRSSFTTLARAIAGRPGLSEQLLGGE